jgi:hypothetical protein
MTLERYVMDLAATMQTKYPDQMIEEMMCCSECDNNLEIDSLVGRVDNNEGGFLYCTKCTIEMVECDIDDVNQKYEQLDDILRRLKSE